MANNSTVKSDDRRATPAYDGANGAPALKDLLAPLLAERGKTAAGQIQVLGLQGIKARLGEQWTKFLPTIQVAVENIVSTNLSSGDVSVRLNDETYLIAFAKDDRDHALAVTKNIAQQLQKMLIGAAGSDAIEIRAVVGEISADNEHGAPTFEAEGTAPEPAPPVSKADQFKKTMADARKRAEEEASLFDIVYAPIWNARQEVLTGYGALAAKERGQGNYLSEHAVLPAGKTDAEILELDLKVVQTAIETMVELYQNKFALLLCCQVHYRTLSTHAGRDAIRDMVAEIPEPVAHLMMVEVVGIPDHTPTTTLGQRLSVLQNHFRTVIVRAPTLDCEVTDYLNTGANCIAYRLPKNIKVTQLAARAKKLVSDAKKAKVALSFEYVSDIPTAELLKDCGAMFLTGDCFGRPLDIPRNMKRAKLSDFQHQVPEHRL